MVLVDTSVWIRFLSGGGQAAAELDRLLGNDEVVGHQLIYGELLIGDRRGRGTLLAAYQLIHQARTVPHVEVVTFVRERALMGRGIGWIDVHLLAAAVVERHDIWTMDRRFASVAAGLGVAHSPAS